MRPSRTVGLCVAAITAMMMATLAVPAVTAVGYEEIVLYGYEVTAGDPAVECSYAVHVQNPGVISQEDDYLNMTIWVEPTGTGASHETMYCRLYLNDGTANTTLGNKTLSAEDDKTVYSNLSYSDPGMSALTLNGTALLWVELGFLNVSDFQVVDGYSSTFGIYATAAGAALMAMIPIIITVAIFAAIIPMLRKIGGKTKR